MHDVRVKFYWRQNEDCVWDTASQVALRSCSREGGRRSLCVLQNVVLLEVICAMKHTRLAEGGHRSQTAAGSHKELLTPSVILGLSRYETMQETGHLKPFPRSVPGGTAVKTLHFRSRGHALCSWLGNYSPICHTVKRNKSVNTRNKASL